jgi:D-alanine--poly(phosphoribitol) ligase subunit 2
MNQQIVDLIVQVSNDLNEQLKNKIEVDKRENAILFGDDGVLDSLALVNLVVLVESAVENKFGKPIILVDGVNGNEKQTHFATVGSLAEYIENLI